MQGPAVPVLKDLLLVGGGHAHVAVLRRFGMRPLPGVRLTLLSQDVLTPYSGMLPGWVAGQYTLDELHIDLAPLCRFAGARLLVDEALGLDPLRRLVLCRDHPALPYDVLSLDVGSTPTTGEVPGVERAVKVKPISTFVQRWEELLQRVRERPGGVRLALVGGGAGGVELALAARARLRTLLDQQGRAADEVSVTLIGAAGELLPSHPPGARRRLHAALARAGVAVHLGSPASALTDGEVHCADGRAVPADEVLWVTQAGAAEWLAASGLEVDERGFVRVHATLQSTSHPQVFAAGDVAAVVPHPREKAGVFAVRQGRPLADNLRRALLGLRLRPFRPQSRFLSLVGTGDLRAVASRGRWSAEGPLVWRWKDRIDRRFMARYRDLPAMDAAPAPAVDPALLDGLSRRALAELPMRCAGCGAKVSAGVLESVLARLRPGRRDELALGLDAPDDAAVLSLPAGELLVQSTDLFRAPVDDPFLAGRIAAVHALNDVWAMGARPLAALAQVVLPWAPPEKQEHLLEQVLAGALVALREADCALAGGHTAEGGELMLGFAVSGTVTPSALLRKGGLRAGDVLLLTKPLGTGTVLAAAMRGRARGRDVQAAWRSMSEPSGAASACLVRHGATAATDVSGFGLLGHLFEMVRASAADAALDLDALPLLPGAEAAARAGLLSSLHDDNARSARVLDDPARATAHPRGRLLFDPQTAGGLLAAVPAARADACLADLRAAGCRNAAVVGRAVERTGDSPRVHLLP